MALNDEILNSLLNLDFNDIRDMNPNWSETMINDYVYKQQNINSIVTVTVNVEDQVTQNTSDIASIAPVVTQNVTDINTNEGNITDNANDISNHINNSSGAHAASAISYDNTASGLAAVNAQEGIDEVDADLDTHISATGAHGVAGDNIGTQDFAQTLVGGAVLLAALVSDASQSTVSVDSPDATDLPSVITLTNEMKADVNQLVTDLNNAITQLNAFLAANQTAKQMSV